MLVLFPIINTLLRPVQCVVLEFSFVDACGWHFLFYPFVFHSSCVILVYMCLLQQQTSEFCIGCLL